MSAYSYGTTGVVPNTVNVTKSVVPETGVFSSRVLAELGCADKPTLLVLNKIDRGGDELALRALHRKAVIMSARREGDVARLRAAILAHFQKGLVEAELFLPWSAQNLRGEIFSDCEVVEERAANDGTHFKVRGEPDAVKRLKKKLGKKP